MTGAALTPDYFPLLMLSRKGGKMCLSAKSALQVDAPIEKVYQVWSNRLNYSEWFDHISQVVPSSNYIPPLHSLALVVLKI